MPELFDFSNTLIHCSSIGKLMTEPKSAEDKKSGELSATAKSHLIDIFIHKKYKRRKEFSNQYVEKGLMVEEDSLTLYSRIKKHVFNKNEEVLQNPFIIGTPDTHKGGESIFKAKQIIDVKSSWDIWTYFAVLAEKAINRDYYWQLQGYMFLTGATSARLAYCLIDTPETLINDAKRKLMYRMNVATTENPEYIKACEELEFSMKYGDMDMLERVIELDVERDDNAIQSIIPKVIKARMFLQDFQNKTIAMSQKN